LAVTTRRRVGQFACACCLLVAIVAVIAVAALPLAPALAYPISTLAGALVGFVSDDRSPLEKSDVVGTYRCVYRQYDLGSNTLTLMGDGKFRQTFRYPDGRLLEGQGTWRVYCPDWLTRDVMFDGFLFVVDYPQSQRVDRPARGGYNMGVHRRFGRVDYLDPGEDAAEKFERVPAGAANE
jgi:hypothetical protein